MFFFCGFQPTKNIALCFLPFILRHKTQLTNIVTACRRYETKHFSCYQKHFAAFSSILKPPKILALFFHAFL